MSLRNELLAAAVLAVAVASGVALPVWSGTLAVELAVLPCLGEPVPSSSGTPGGAVVADAP